MRIVGSATRPDSGTSCTGVTTLLAERFAVLECARSDPLVLYSAGGLGLRCVVAVIEEVVVAVVVWFQ